MNSKRILIVGGVAAGASAATRARRVDEHAEIILFEKGPYVSFANCGLPYHVGGVIPEESSLLLVTPERFKRWFDIDVRVRHEVTAIDRVARRVAVLDHETGRTSSEEYDALVLAPGSRAVVPPLPGVDLPGVFLLRTVPDAREVRAWIERRAARRALVIGAGPIGVEVAENLRHRSLEVDLVELQDQILPTFDPEVIQPFAQHLSDQGVRLRLGQALEGIRSAADGSLEVVCGGETSSADLLILALGARPETSLARSCGLALGPGGGIAVDASMRTSDPHIWAAGDAVESACSGVTSGCNVALAGIANRQGRVAADAIAGRPAQMRGALGTHVCGAFGMIAAATGVSEKRLIAQGRSDYQCVWLHPKNHAAYYPGAESIHMKLVFSSSDGVLLGAQAVGKQDVEKRIDVIAMAMQLGGSVYDLEQAELCYAPQFGSAKDPVNLAGMIAANQLRGDASGVSWAHYPGEDGVLLVDVREQQEFARRHVPGARNLPLSELRDRLSELPRDRDVWVYCQTGKRSYDAARLLLQRGFRVKTLLGGLDTYDQFHAAEHHSAK